MKIKKRSKVHDLEALVKKKEESMVWHNEQAAYWKTLLL